MRLKALSASTNFNSVTTIGRQILSTLQNIDSSTIPSVATFKAEFVAKDY
jgi:hypothetical protein